MQTAKLKFSPRILARLGEELNQTFDQSILELVKNAYDADAYVCKIELFDTGDVGGLIRVSDDGNGMDQNLIQDSWLVLGKSEKNSDVMTPLGRIPAGSKGLGRLAALRMGEKVFLSSVKKGVPRSIHSLCIDWSEFEKATAVEDVSLSINTEKRTSSVHGTVIELRSLRTAVRADEVRKLARSLILLTDPFDDNTAGFRVELESAEFADIEKLVRKKYFDEADFHLSATLDSQGQAKVSLLDWRGEELASADHFELKRKNPQEPYRTPACQFDLWTFLLKAAGSFMQGRKSRIGEIRQWLNHFGGVHIYQDSVRVAPYGDSGNDWLQINLSRARSPDERPSTNNSIGRVVIKSRSIYKLTQKTDRSGFIEDDTFIELTSFALDALEWLAKWRLAQAEQRRATEKQQSEDAARREESAFDAALLKIPQASRSTVEIAFKKYASSRDREAEALRKEIQLYRTLSTAGITAATFAHESQGNPLKVITLNLKTLQRRINEVVAVQDRPRLLGPTENILISAGALSTLGAATLGLIKAEKRKIGKVDLHNAIKKLINLMEPFWRGRETQVDLEFSTDGPYIYASEAAFESILANLINNSVDAFRRAGTHNRLIKIKTATNGFRCYITVSDTGPGIDDIKINEIWLPGVTSSSDGTGLGLTIVRDTVRDLGGSVSVSAHGQLGGAEFLIDLPVLGR